MFTRSIIVFAIAVLSLVTGPRARAVTTQQKCAAAKLKAAGKSLNRQMACYARAKNASVAVDPTCLSRVQGKADAAITKAGVACPGTAGDIDAGVSGCLGAFLQDDPGNGPCPAGSAKQIGKGAQGELRCQAKEMLKPGTFAACDTKEDGKTTAGLTKAGGCVSAVAPDIDRCGTTLTASVVATTTTSTTLPYCGAFLTQWGTSGTGDGQFTTPVGIAFDESGNVYVGDRINNNIQLFTNTGAFLTKWGSTGSGDGQFSAALAMAVDGSGNLFVSDGAPPFDESVPNNNRIQKFTSTGTLLTKWGSTGSGDGQFSHPLGNGVDGSGNVYVADCENNRIQKFTSTGTFLTTWGSAGSGDGQFNCPLGLSVDGNGNVFVTEENNDRIQKFTSTGTFLTTWGSFGSGDGKLVDPLGLSVDGNGNVFVADCNNHRIQKFTNDGTFLTKWGSFGSGHGRFNCPKTVAVDANGDVYVTDGLARVQKFACP